MSGRGDRAPRGFTLLELLLAMAIGSLVLAGGFVIVQMAERMDDRFADRLETSNQLSYVQRTLARSLHSIVAAPEGFEPREAALAAVRTAERIERLRQREENGDESRDRDPSRVQNPDENPAEAAPGPGGLDARGEPDVEPAPPRFRMGHVDRRGAWEDRDPEQAAAGDRRLELLLTRPPLGDAPLGAPVRGALELVYTPRPAPDGDEDRWRLQWTPLRPAGRPTILLENLVLAEWSVTDSQGQFDRFEAYEADDLPWAFRIILWTDSGAKVDWMFDLGAASTSGDPL